MLLNFLRSACLVLGVAQALSDVNPFSNQVLGDDQILGDDLGSNSLHPRFDDHSFTDQSLNTDATEDDLSNNNNNKFLSDTLGAYNPIADDPFADNLLTDNLLADGGQSCVQVFGGSRLRARENSCTSPYDAPNLKSSAESERVPTAEEVEEYWCAQNPRKQGALNLKPVCSVQPGALTFESLLRSFELTGLNFLNSCKDEDVYCCYSWSAYLGIDFSFMALAPVGDGVWCVKTFKFGFLEIDPLVFRR